MCDFLYWMYVDVVGNPTLPPIGGFFAFCHSFFIIMFTVSVPNQTDGKYDAVFEFDTIDDAIDCVFDEIENVYNHHSVVIHDGDDIIGKYSGVIACGDHPYSFDGDFGPVI